MNLVLIYFSYLVVLSFFQGGLRYTDFAKKKSVTSFLITFLSSVDTHHGHRKEGDDFCNECYRTGCKRFWAVTEPPVLFSFSIVTSKPVINSWRKLHHIQSDIEIYLILGSSEFFSRWTMLHGLCTKSLNNVFFNHFPVFSRNTPWSRKRRWWYLQRMLPGAKDFEQ